MKKGELLQSKVFNPAQAVKVTLYEKACALLPPTGVTDLASKEQQLKKETTSHRQPTKANRQVKTTNSENQEVNRQKTDKVPPNKPTANN